MLDRTDQLELLAFIEGELDARQMAALRKRLSNEPRALAMIERICEDRTGLRAIGSPELPEDFVARLEPLLARPMLTEPVLESAAATFNKPGEFRRQHRRQHVRMRWGRLAAAAVLFFGLLVGTWAAVNGLNGTDNGFDRDSRTAVNDSGRDEAIAGDSSADELVVTALSGTIHHNWPDLLKPTELAATKAASDRPSSVANTTVKNQPIVAEFAMVMTVKDAAEAERVLTAALTPSDSEAALVRNFNWNEATRIAHDWAVADRGQTGGDNGPVVSSTGAAASTTVDIRLMAERVRERMAASPKTGSSSAAGASDQSAQLLGPVELAPSLEQQLDWSQRGATHTIAVSAAQLNVILERLASMTQHATTLRLLPPVNSASTAAVGEGTMTDPLAAWLTDGRSVRQAIQRLQHESPNATVLIPILVQTDRR